VKKIHLLLLFIFNFYLAQGQNTNVLQEQHVKISGTILYIIPPDSFVTSQKFMGFINKATGATIVVHKIPQSTSGDGYYKIDEENWKKEDVLINGKYTTYYESEEYANDGRVRIKWIVISPDNSYLFQGTFPKNNKEHYSKEIKASLQSLIIK